jgi:rhamnosyl/mannosyltransferase
MKILHVYKDYFPVLGGIENYVRQLAEHMVAQRHEVEVLVTNPAPRTVRENRAGVKITKAARFAKIASAPLSIMLPLEFLRHYYSANPPDIIHLHTPYPVGEMAFLVSSWLPRFGRKRPRVVLTYHSDVVKQRRILKFYAPFLRMVLRRVDKIIATSPNYIQSSSFLKPVEARVAVVPLATDVERFGKADPELVKDLRERHAAQNQVLLLFAGRLRYYKGLQFLLEAMPQVRAGAKLLIIGVGPMEQELKAQAERLQLGERAVFLGEISDAELPAYYAASDIFILPACERSEAFGIVQLEAMASGKPVISTELGTGTSYANLNGETGLVVPPANPPALAEAINKLVASPELREKLGRHGQERTRAEFSLEKMLGEIEQIYIRLLSGSG